MMDDLGFYDKAKCLVIVSTMRYYIQGLNTYFHFLNPLYESV